MEYDWMTRDLTIQLGNDESTNDVRYARGWGQPAWEVSLVNTGLFTEKAQRIMRVANYIEEERFFAGYGDDVSDVDLSALVKFHKNHGRLATITAVQINLPYGVVDADDTGLVSGFIERPPLPHWINGGFMLFEREVLDIIATNQFENLETEVLPYLAEQNELMIYRHTGFWQSMNTMKDTLLLEKIWRENPPWKVWDED
jgi:glucose-1-phosphate cytidylyltransferase